MQTELGGVIIKRTFQVFFVNDSILYYKLQYIILNYC